MSSKLAPDKDMALRLFGYLLRIFILLLYIIPLYLLVATSLKGSNVRIFRHAADLIFLPVTHAYNTIISNGQLESGIQNSAIIAIGTTVITLFLATPAAYGLARSRNRGFISVGISLCVVLQMVPQTAAIIPLYKILGAWGLLNTYPGVILSDVSFLLPFSILIMRPFMQGIPQEIEEAAMVDGAAPLTIFIRIVLPLARNGVTTGATLIFILTWGEFIYSISILSSTRMYPLSAVISQQISAHGVSWSNLMALSVMGTLPLFFVYIFGRKKLAAGLTFGAVK